MRILLVYPIFPTSFWSFDHALKIYGRNALLPPLGLLTVAAMLPATWELRLIDMNVQPLTDGDLKWADYVFISGMAVQRKSAHDVEARSHALGKPTIGGGPLFTGEYTLFPNVNHFVLNESEPTIARLVADLEAGKPKRLYRSRDYADMTTSPVPLWKLLDLRQYAYMGIQYTRGCPYDCEFCNVTALLGRQPRTKNASQIIAELDALKAAGWSGGVFFVDDNLIGNRPALKKDLLPALIQWQKQNGPMVFNTQASINLADDPDLMDAMTDAGFEAVFVGIETSDPEALKECKKTQNRNRSLVDDVHKLQAHGLEVQAGFIVGFDHDTTDCFQQQADFIQACGIVTAMVGQLQAPPGTRLINRMWQEGRLRGQSTGNNTDSTTNIIPKMGVENLHKGYLWLLDQLFAPKPAYARIKTFLRHYQLPKVRQPFTAASIPVFFRALYHLGVKGQERFQYWNLLLWTLATRPGHLSYAIKMAMLTHHYRRVAQENASRPLAAPLMLLEDLLASRQAQAPEPATSETVNLSVSAAAPVAKAV